MAAGHIHVCYPDWLAMHHDSVHSELAGVFSVRSGPLCHVCLLKNTCVHQSRNTQSDLSHTLVAIAAEIFLYQLFRLIKKHSDLLNSTTSSTSEFYILQV